MGRAVYAGSFDPITLGHLWMTWEGARLFDSLVVAIGNNPGKRYTFSTEQRLTFLRDAVDTVPGCEVDVFEDRYLVDYARDVRAGCILRGIRNEADFIYERAMRHVNHDLNPDVVAVFLMPPRDLAPASSRAWSGLMVGKRLFSVT